MKTNIARFAKLILPLFGLIVIGSALGGGSNEPTATTATAPALSGDDRVAEGIATMMAYDLKCERVRAAFKEIANGALETVSTSAFKAATERVLSFYNNAGLTKFCAVNKPAVDRAMANYRP